MKGIDSKVVDLNEFKAARAARQLDLLTAETGPRPEAPGTEDALSTRKVAHRARMLAHLEGSR
jgi:hypothetical protein